MSGELTRESQREPITALLLLEFTDPEGIDPRDLERGDEIDEGVAQMVAGDAAEVVMSHYRVKATVAHRLSALTLGELQLLHLGLVVIGEQERVDHKLVELWSELLRDVTAAVRAKVAAGV